MASARTQATPAQDHGKLRTLEAVFVDHAQHIASTDARSYPSKNTKQGFHPEMMSPHRSLLKAIVKVTGKERLQQLTGERLIDATNDKHSDAFKKLCERQRLKYTSWRRDYVFSLRVMLSHLRTKYNNYMQIVQGGGLPRSHSDWLIDLYQGYADYSGAMASDQVEGRMVKAGVASFPGLQDPPR